ncbi:MAG: glycosyltransferase family protein [Magnetococcales bacterium]|nr:glycosyltransferase family protein [Magnetococcales bacterium]
MPIHAESLQRQLTTAIRLHQNGQIREAIRIHQALLKQFPGHPHILHLYGLARQELGDLQGALHLLSQAAAKEPDNRDFRLSLGFLLKLSGRSHAALACFRDLQHRHPDDAEISFHLGDTCMDLGEAEAALAPFRNAIRLQPTFKEAWINLGLSLKGLGAVPEALHCFQQVIQAHPHCIEGYINLGMTHLLMGDYAEGWRAYEWRLQLTQQAACIQWPPILQGNPAPPRWDGTPLAGKSILVVAEQGFGDILQFVRYLLPLKSGGARILFSAPPTLIPLLRRLPAIDDIRTPEQFTDAEEIDCHCPLLSLPLLFNTQLESVPAPIPYIQADPELARQWAGRLRRGENVLVGLVWRGKPLHPNDPLRRRSCTLQDLAPLAQVAGVTWISLQQEDGSSPPLQPPPGMAILDLRAALRDFAQTAAILDNLDLLISIDTSVAHLGGALGKAVWLLLPIAPDWRWTLDQPRSPWYPDIPLFRQTVPHSWQEPLQAMAEALPSFVHTIQAGRPPG